MTNNHSLKVWPEYFQDLYMGRKTFELRYDDRDFRTGDTVALMEWKPRKREFTGRVVEKKITGIFRVARMIECDHRGCILSLGDA